jgi:hypothetical protein
VKRLAGNDIHVVLSRFVSLLAVLSRLVICRRRQSLPNERDQFVYHLINRHAIGLQVQGIRSRLKSTDWSARIPPVTVLLLLQNLLKPGHLPLLLKLLAASSSSLLGRCIEEDLALGLGENLGSLIASFGDDIDRISQSPLDHPQGLADRQLVCHLVNILGHVRPSYLLAYISAIQQHLLVAEFYLQLLGQAGEGSFIGPVDTIFDCQQCHAAVHRAGIEKLVSQLLGDLPSHATLACSSWSVDGYDHGIPMAGGMAG